MITRRIAHLATWLAALVLILWGLLRLGEGALATPPVGSLEAMRAWLEGSGLAVAVFAVLRLIALATTTYLLATTLFGVGARLSRVGDLMDLADRISVPIVRKVVTGTASVSITAGTLAGAALPVTATFVLDQRPDRATTVDDVTLVAAETSPPIPATPEFNAATDPTPPTQPQSAQTHPLSGGDPSRMIVVTDDRPLLFDLDAAGALSDTRTWLVEPGDHLWSIAERALADDLDEQPDQDAVFNYWRTLVRANKDRLVNTDNPDLILPGQELLLPAHNG